MAFTFAALAEAAVSAAATYFNEKSKGQQKWRSDVERKLDQILSNTEAILADLQQLRVFIMAAEKQASIQRKTDELTQYKRRFYEFTLDAESPVGVSPGQKENLKAIYIPVANISSSLSDEGISMFAPVAVGVSICLFCQKALGWRSENIIPFVDFFLHYFKSCIDPASPDSFGSSLANAKRYIAEFEPLIKGLKEQNPAGFGTLGCPGALATSVGFWVGHLDGSYNSRVELGAFDGYNTMVPGTPPQPPFFGFRVAEYTNSTDCRYHGYAVAGHINNAIANLSWAKQHVEGLAGVVEHIKNIVESLEQLKNDQLDENKPNMRLLLAPAIS